MMEYIVVGDSAAVARYAADMIEGEITSNGEILLGLAGGSTPRSTYEELAGRSIDWSDTTAWITDGRWVPPDHDDANQKMVRESLVGPTGVSFLAPDTTIGSVKESADAFSEQIVPIALSSSRSIVLLGIGADGHTASLFPGSRALAYDGVRYVDNYVETLGVWRLTATFDLLATAHVVVFLVTGAAKAPVIASIMAGADVPSAHVTAGERVLWLLDEAAASGL